MLSPNYTELNPLRARLLSEPELWPWSSAAIHCGTNQHDAFLALDAVAVGTVIAGCDGPTYSATGDASARGSVVVPAGFQEQHGNGSSLQRRVSAIVRQR
jgi:hypothetical protein